MYRQINVQSRREAASYVAQHPDALGNHELPADTHSSAATHPIILIVDDNLRYRTQMRRMVSKSYPQALICEAENTRVALRQVEDTAPQLAFVDVVLGDENGIDCARRIHAQSATCRSS